MFVYNFELVYFVELLSTLKAIKTLLKGHMINRILHSWSFHVKFNKLAEGSFDKFHHEMTTSVISSFYLLD